jgi:methylglutaconyl-CoA hydratase
MNVVEAALDARGVLTVTLADEANRNALSSRLVGELSEALDAAEEDPEVRVVVLTNRGRVFCAGADLSERSSGSGTGGDDDRPAAVRRPEDLFGRFARSAKPYVGRIAGHCVAGGMGLAAAMDISIAAHDARFGFTEVRVGVAPAVISVVCLPKLRPADARAAFLRGTRFPAAEAARMGLINAAVPADRLDDEVAAAVDDLLAGGPGALAASKRLLARVPGMPIDEAFTWTGALSAELFAGDEARAGMRAYLEKRPAPWVVAAPEGQIPGQGG